MAFCTNCGQSVQAANKYCASCGASLHPSTASVPYALPIQPSPPPVYQNVLPPAPVYQTPLPGYPAETVKYIFPMLWINQPSGKTDTYTLIVTEHRSIFARRTQEVENDANKEAHTKVETDHKGFWGKWAASLNTNIGYEEHYNKLTPDRIMRETPGNFSVENAAIRKIKLTIYTVEDVNGADYHIEFQTVNGNMRFQSVQIYEKTMKLAYGKIVEV